MDEGATVETVGRQLGVPAALMRICAVNGATAATDVVLREGDELALLPAVSGGGG